MAILTIVAHPAKSEKGWVAIEITKTTYRDRKEIKTAAEAQAVFDAAVGELEKQRGGVHVSAYIFDGDGRKPNGFKKLQLQKFIPTPQQLKENA